MRLGGNGYETSFAARDSLYFEIDRLDNSSQFAWHVLFSLLTNLLLVKHVTLVLDLRKDSDSGPGSSD